MTNRQRNKLCEKHLPDFRKWLRDEYLHEHGISKEIGQLRYKHIVAIELEILDWETHNFWPLDMFITPPSSLDDWVGINIILLGA